MSARFVLCVLRADSALDAATVLQAALEFDDVIQVDEMAAGEDVHVLVWHTGEQQDLDVLKALDEQLKAGAQ